MPPANTQKPPSTSMSAASTAMTTTNGSTNHTAKTDANSSTGIIPNSTMQSIQRSPLISSKTNHTMLSSAAAAAATAAMAGSKNRQPVSQSDKVARQKAWREVSNEDEKRMRFLALLCGKNAFPPTTNMSRERSNSTHENDDSPPSATTTADTTKSSNYTPTTPTPLTRRILHTSGVGYYDPSVSLLLSAASDRFLATVLTQAKACRDRRLEGIKSTLGERRERKRHRRRVWKERDGRERRFREEVERRKDEVDVVICREKGGVNKGASTAITPTSATGAVSESFSLKPPDLERLKEFRKENHGMDAEEDYYHKYYGGDDGENDQDDSDDDDSDEEIDDKQYDLLLRDIVRPLGAWGFDITAKVGFNPSTSEMDDENEYIEENDDKEEEDGDAVEDEAEDDDAENEDGDNESDADDGENGKKPPSPAKKSPVKKKAAPKKNKKRKAEDGDDDNAGGCPAAKKPAAKSTDKKPAASSGTDTKDPLPTAASTESIPATEKK